MQAPGPRNDGLLQAVDVGHRVDRHRHMFLHKDSTAARSPTSNSSWPPERYSRTFQLPDGRTLAWAEAGSPKGCPFFVIHGFPGSRLEAHGFETIGRALDVMFYCIDRPGYGLSTFQPGRRISDMAVDLQLLAEHLHLPRYVVMGVSGGGPSALACAWAIPPENLAAVGLVCTAAPWDAGGAGPGGRDVRWYQWLTKWTATYVPGPQAWLLDKLLGAVPWYAGTAGGHKLLHSIAAKAAANPHAAALSREQLLSLFLEPFAQGARGFVQDAYLLSHPFGFPLEEVRFASKVHMWHGTKDVNSPLSMVRRMAKRLPDCELHELEGDTHFTIMERLEDIVLQLLAVAKG